jgi:antitoxin (DNA-binding transcriptional repressor) of toxin-antitoxin stability system
MRVVGLKILKNRLAEYVRIAAAGERVLVTDRDRVVAELIAPQAGTPEFARDALLAEAVRAGWLRPPVLRRTDVPESLPVASFNELQRELERDRGDR